MYEWGRDGGTKSGAVGETMELLIFIFILHPKNLFAEQKKKFLYFPRSNNTAMCLTGNLTPVY